MADQVERRLTTILAADVAEYSRLMRADEVGTLVTFAACRAIVDGLIAGHRGRIGNTAGDSVPAEFPSAAEALSCPSSRWRSKTESCHRTGGCCSASVSISATRRSKTAISLAMR